jgi:hypothetical protein
MTGGARPRGRSPRQQYGFDRERSVDPHRCPNVRPGMAGSGSYVCFDCPFRPICHPGGHGPGAKAADHFIDRLARVRGSRASPPPSCRQKAAPDPAVESQVRAAFSTIDRAERHAANEAARCRQGSCWHALARTAGEARTRGGLVGKDRASRRGGVRRARRREDVGVEGGEGAVPLQLEPAGLGRAAWCPRQAVGAVSTRRTGSARRVDEQARYASTPGIGLPE